jgi:NADH-quinone oxidoreductase subunit F
MEPISRVLDLEPVDSLDAYEAGGGGAGLRAAVDQGGEATLAVLEASGLRGRGGAGFPTAAKWRSVLANVGPEPATVVVNAAEGEPGTFKDRAIIRANPYRVIEGALVAAVTIGADEVVVATKQRFEREVSRLQGAAKQVEAAGWAPGVAVRVVEGPDEYLYGEETALLEVVEGRLPFPRLAPPWRRGVDEGAGGTDEAAAGGAVLAPAGDGPSSAPPVLVNNVETLANVALVLANGPDWFREVGTPESPGTLVCTITGRMEGAGVVEVAMGTPIGEVIEAVGRAPLSGVVSGVLPGVSAPLLPGDRLDTPLTYEAMAAAGTGLGTGGFIVLDGAVDPVAVAEGVSRFLAVESCGQCTPCKGDGLAIRGALGRLREGAPEGDELRVVEEHLLTVEDGARCYLATQHRQAVDGLLARFPAAFAARASGAEASEPFLVAELVDLVEGPGGVIEARYDDAHLAKQPDWTFDAEDSGRSPADRLDQARGDDLDDLDKPAAEGGAVGTEADEVAAVEAQARDVEADVDGAG